VTRRVAVERELQELNAHLAAKVQERTLKVRRYAKRLRSRKHELEMANRDLEMFSYSASHDLRTPLWVLTVFVDMLVKDAGERLPQDILENIHKIQHAARNMTALVDDLMKLAKVSKQTVSRSIVDVTALAEKQVALLRNKDPERNVEVVIERGLSANVDEGLLGIALENLIGNAWKYSAYVPQARIRVGAEVHDGETILFVEDNGAGFDIQDARDLFKPFHRMHSDALFEGTGIGLAIVQRVVGLHGGSIWAEAAAGKGATFYFRLGLDARIEAPRGSTHNRPGATPGGRGRV
jgi:light-regulated signal transduction histidine kinase (bacteriophytochrome)